MPRFENLPNEALADEAIVIRLSDLPPDTEVTIRAAMRDDTGSRWQSEATVRADGAGRIDLSRQAPLAGSYDSIEPMGFLWSMTGPTNDGSTRWTKTTVAPTPIDLSAVVDGRVVAEARHTRLAVAPGVVRREVRERGLNAVFFIPPGPGPFPTIVLLSGSGGGLSEPQAALYASHGYAALALAYFRGDGLPHDLLRIPLEYFETAIAWLQAQPEVDRQRLAVGGGSRDGELSLLLG